MFCENCGAKNGETDEEYIHRIGLLYTHPNVFTQTAFAVSPTAWGDICQYCEKAPEKGYHFDRRTGLISLMQRSTQRTETMSSLCTRCQAFYDMHPLQDGHHMPFPGVKMGAITCAFPDGTFTPHHWNCQTMIALRELVNPDQESTSAHFFHAFHYNADDSRFGVLVIPESEDEAVQFGYLVMLWYKDRGRTSQAFVVSDDEEPHPLTLKTAEMIVMRYGVMANKERG